MCQNDETPAPSITPAFRDYLFSRSALVSSRGLAVTWSAAEDGVDERGRVERRQVIGTLAEPDQLHRDAELALHGDHDAALGRPVELGQHDAGDVYHLGED